MTSHLNTLEYTVQIFDTDCYGVMWHGAYTKWLEMARVNYLADLGLSLKALADDHDIIFPVAEQHFKYLKSAFVEEKLVFKTTMRYERPRMIFSQKVFRKKVDGDQDIEQVFEAETICVAVTREGSICRKLPDVLQQALLN